MSRDLITFLPAAYIVYRKTMLSVMSVCQSTGEGTCDQDVIDKSQVTLGPPDVFKRVDFLHMSLLASEWLDGN